MRGSQTVMDETIIELTKIISTTVGVLGVSAMFAYVTAKLL